MDRSELRRPDQLRIFSKAERDENFPSTCIRSYSCLSVPSVFVVFPKQSLFASSPTPTPRRQCSVATGRPRGFHVGSGPFASSETARTAELITAVMCAKSMRARSSDG
jgi:hypothetical protein